MEDDKNTTFTNTTFSTEIENSEFLDKMYFIDYVLTCIIITIGLPLTLVTIYALYSLVREDHVAPIYVINLLITDFLQLCCLIVSEIESLNSLTFARIMGIIYPWLLYTSVGFMVCVSLERYLVIAHPLWYRFRRNIKTSVVVCVVVWVAPAVLFSIIFFSKIPGVQIVFSIFFLIPFPFFVFFLVGTLRALSTSVSVSSDEKRRIVGILVLVLLIYTLLFLPAVIYFLLTKKNKTLNILGSMFLRLSPLADLSLYIFIRKETFAKCLAAACCCKKENNDNPESTVNVDDI